MGGRRGPVAASINRPTMKKIAFLPFLFLTVLLMPTRLSAQWAIQRLPQTDPLAGARTLADSIFLRIPFFEDFSQQQPGPPNPAHWQSGGGTWINNSFPIGQPTRNVATFDGVNAAGRAYNAQEVEAIGEADQLVSNYFDLSIFGEETTLELWFRWQPAGRGENPDPEDSLRLDFKGSLDRWVRVWSVPGDTLQPFRETRVKFQPRFVHENFQFRFVNISRQSGPYDAWHLDYLYLHINAVDNPAERIDVAWTEEPPSPLKRFHSMPARHFLANPSLHLRDSIESEVRNLSNTFNVYFPRAFVRERYSGRPWTELPTVAISQNGLNRFDSAAFIDARQAMKVRVPLRGLTFPQSDTLAIETRFLIDSIEAQRIIPTRRNDTLRTVHYLKDYYAYDDGSAEYAVGLNQRFGQAAIRYVIAEPDVLNAIDVYVAPLGPDLIGRTYNIKVWTRIDTLDDRRSVLVHRQNVPVIYGPGKDQLVRVRLLREVPVRDTIFIGFEQIEDDMIPIGYDENNDSGQEIFVNIASEWRRNRQLRGSLMFRPVFEKLDVTAIEPPSGPEPKTVWAWPNPFTEELHIDAAARLAEVYTLSGVLIARHAFGQAPYERTIHTAGWVKGTYLLRLWDGQQWHTRKLIRE